MIRSFADNNTQRFFETGKSKHLPPDVLKRAMMRLLQLNAATKLEDLRTPASNNLEALRGDRKGQLSVRINQQWRLCFTFESGDATNVSIVDYH